MTYMNELTMNEMAVITGGAMTRKEREEALAPKDDDNIVQAVVRAGLRKVVSGIDAVGDLVEPFTSQCTGEDARTALKNIVKGAWRTVTGWF